MLPNSCLNGPRRCVAFFLTLKITIPPSIEDTHTDAVRSEGEDTVEDTKIRSKIPRYGEDTMISQDLLMFRVLHT